jgi:hypothetical protein
MLNSSELDAHHNVSLAPIFYCGAGKAGLNIHRPSDKEVALVCTWSVLKSTDRYESVCFATGVGAFKDLLCSISTSNCNYVVRQNAEGNKPV